MNVRVGNWAPKNWCFWTVVLEKALVSPLDCKEIQPVHPKGDQSWEFIGRTDVETTTPILWPPDAKYWLIWKDTDAGKDWRQEEKGTTRGWDGWMASLTQWTRVWVDSGSWYGQECLVCCRSKGHKESNMTEWLDWLDWTYVGYFHLLAIMLLWTFMSGKLLKLLNSQFLPQTNGIKIPERWGDRWWLDFFLKLSLPSNSNG